MESHSRPSRTDTPRPSAYSADTGTTRRGALGRKLRAHDLAAHVVDADDGPVVWRLVAEDAALGLHIAVHAAMARQVVRRDVQHDRHIAVQRLDQVELVGRQLQHIDRAAVQAFEIQHADADIAANTDILAGLPQDMADQRRRGRLAVGAGDADDARALVLLEIGYGAGEQLHVADHRHAHHLRHLHETVGLRETVGNARRQHQSCKGLPVASVEIDQRNAGIRRRLARGFIIVPGADPRAPGHQGAARRKARTAKAVDRDIPAIEGVEPGSPSPHLNFRVARPARARRKAMIQKRMTTVGSDQPFFSKWWWIGAIRKKRFPVNLK